MVKRLISANASDIAKFTKEELLQSIKACEGRVILSEEVAREPSVGGDISSAEVDKAFGADMILLNGLDVFDPFINGLYQSEEEKSGNPIADLKHLVGLPIGMNLEPVDNSMEMASNRVVISKGRQTSIETFQKANELGLDFICLTGNPGVGVSNQAIADSIKVAKEHFDGVIIAGKMHYAGSSEAVVDLKWIEKFLENGTDILLLRAVGTVIGVGEDEVRKGIEMAHSYGRLTMTAIGTSQEGSDAAIIQRIGLTNKILGADIQHIGDANMGLVGVRNISVLSDTIRGARHTVSRMARSINR